MALDQNDKQFIADMIQQNNQSMMANVTQMIQQLQPQQIQQQAPVQQYVPPQVQQAPVQYMPQQQQTQPQIQIIQPSNANSFGNITLEQLATMPDYMRQAFINYAGEGSVSPEVQQLKQELQDLRDAQMMLLWQNQANQSRHHSTKKKVAIGVGIVVGVGGVAYAVHKISHRHDKDRMFEAGLATANRFIDAKYGKPE
jgi:hypothetical protein